MQHAASETPVSDDYALPTPSPAPQLASPHLHAWNAVLPGLDLPYSEKGELCCDLLDRDPILSCDYCKKMGLPRALWKDPRHKNAHFKTRKFLGIIGPDGGALPTGKDAEVWYGWCCRRPLA
jgi:hypothetical protein